MLAKLLHNSGAFSNVVGFYRFSFLWLLKCLHQTAFALYLLLNSLWSLIHENNQKYMCIKVDSCMCLSALWVRVFDRKKKIVHKIIQPFLSGLRDLSVMIATNRKALNTWRIECYYMLKTSWSWSTQSHTVMLWKKPWQPFVMWLDKCVTRDNDIKIVNSFDNLN